MTKSIRAVLAALASAALVACGGGGGDSGSGGATPSSFWTMDAHTYVNGGNSAVSTSSASGTLVTTAVISTATTSGGDTSNGAYSGSSLSFVFKGAPLDGAYNVVPDRAAFLAADAATSPILVDVNVGIAVTTGSSVYTASSGRVLVTRDNGGVYHFSTLAAIPTSKTLDVLGGVAGSPASMALKVTDAY